MEILPLELRKLGLTEKEVQVYLAGLELGPSSILKIAQKAKIVRTTTYEIIKSLEKKKLFTESKRGKKRYFVAQSPDYLLGILRIQKRELEEKERELIRIIASLRAKYYLKNKKEIRIYSGKEGKKSLLDDFLTTPSKEIYVLGGLVSMVQSRRLEEIYKKIKTRLGKIEVKEIFPQFKKSKLNFVKRRSLPKLEDYFSDTLIIADKIFFFTGKNSFCIEQENIVNLAKSLFKIIWDFTK